MSWLPKRDKLDPVQASAVDFVVAQEGKKKVEKVGGGGQWRGDFENCSIVRLIDWGRRWSEELRWEND